MAASIDDQMMHLALDQAAQAAALKEVPVGAVIYRGSEVLAVAHNLRESASDPTAHAEIIALRQAAERIGSWRLDSATMAVTLEPCPMCAGALINARIERLIYGAADPKMGCVDTLHQLLSDRRFNHQVEVHSGVMADQCAKVLGDFFSDLRSR